MDRQCWIYSPEDGWIRVADGMAPRLAAGMAATPEAEGEKVADVVLPDPPLALSDRFQN